MIRTTGDWRSEILAPCFSTCSLLILNVFHYTATVNKDINGTRILVLNARRIQRLHVCNITRFPNPQTLALAHILYLALSFNMTIRFLFAVFVTFVVVVATPNKATSLRTTHEEESRTLLDVKICPRGANTTYVGSPNKVLAANLVCCPSLTRLFSVEGCGFGCCSTCPTAYVFKNATCANPTPCKNGTSFFNIAGCGCGCRPACPNGTGVIFLHPCACTINFVCPDKKVPFSLAGCGCGCKPKV
jgi:hypothetical protein